MNDEVKDILVDNGFKKSKKGVLFYRNKNGNTEFIDFRSDPPQIYAYAGHDKRAEVSKSLKRIKRHIISFDENQTKLSEVKELDRRIEDLEKVMEESG